MWTSSTKNRGEVEHSTSVRPFIQPKLKVNQPNDEYEQEADAVADKVMRMADSQPFFSSAINIQRKCAHCEEEDKKRLQRKEQNLVIQRQDPNAPAAPSASPSTTAAPTTPTAPAATPTPTPATPTGSASTLATAGPSPARAASASDALAAVMALPQVSRLVQDQKQRLLNSLSQAWTDSSLFGKFFEIAIALGLGSGLAMAIYSSRNNPAALDFFASPLSGTVLQVPSISAVPWANAFGFEMNFDRTDPNSPARNQMFGVHFDVGRFLPRSFGFGPVDSFEPIGAPPAVNRKEASLASSEQKETAAAEEYVTSLDGKGQNLSKEERGFFEPKFGSNFSDVKIHSDVKANDSAKSLNALAYTHQNHIVFGESQFKPASNEGRRLIAHELTHVVQQQSNKIQRAPVAAATANWWDDKAVGNRASEKFWKDIHLFFPKDGRKFSGSGMDNITNIDCDDNGMVKIGKDYWEENDATKRKASIAAMIEKRDVKRFDEGRIDNEDLTDKIVSKLKALSGDGVKSYIAKLNNFSALIKNDQIIAYLQGDDKTKATIVKDAQDKLLDWKFDNDRLTDSDFRDERINTRLRGLSTAGKLAKEQKAKELAQNAGEDTTKLQSFLLSQTDTSTPVPEDATVNAAGGFTMSLPNVDVIVLPDTSGGKGNDTSFTTNLPAGRFRFQKDSTGLITKFLKNDGKTPLQMPSKLVFTIQTRYANISNVDQTSAYGRGTTPQDIQWGGKTLRFHEGSHGKGFIDFIRSHTWPSLAIGTVKQNDFKTINDQTKAMGTESCDLVDQVGVTQDDFIKTPAGKASGIVSCRK